MLACSGSETGKRFCRPASTRRQQHRPHSRRSPSTAGCIASRPRVPISEATVSVINGSDAGRSATTDTSGNFSFTGDAAVQRYSGRLRRGILLNPCPTGEQPDTNHFSRPARTGDPAFGAGDRRRHIGADHRHRQRKRRESARFTPPMLPENTASRVVSISATAVSRTTLPTGMNLILDTLEGNSAQSSLTSDQADSWGAVMVCDRPPG